MKYLPLLLSTLAIFLVLVSIQWNKQTAERTPSTIDPLLQNLSEDSGVRPTPVVVYPIPETLSFAGEPVPMHDPDVRERLDKELHVNTYWHNNTIFLFKRANRWFPQISEILKEEGIPDDFKYLPLIESALLNDVSPANAVGFWQIRKDAGQEFGLEINRQVDERYDPLKSTRAACRYLKKAYARFGSWTLAAASYNRGMSGVDRALKDQHVESYYDLYLNDETARYVFRILACKEILEHPERYGFKIDPGLLYDQEKLRFIEINETVTDLPEYARSIGINYKILKRYNPWLRDDRLTVRRGEVYTIAIPENQ